MLHKLIQGTKAWWRGDKRVAPGVRGRLYTKPGDTGPNVHTKTKGKVTLGVRVWRAATGQWEEVK